MHFSLRSYGVVVGSVTLAVLLTLWLKPILSHSIFIMFFAAVSFSAWDGGLKSGLLATVLSVIACNYLFLSTIYLQKQISPATIILLLIFSLVSLLISGLNEQLKVARKSSLESLIKAEEARAERDQLLQQERAARESAEAANCVKDKLLAVLYHAMIKAVELHNQLQSSEERLRLSLQAAQMGTWDWNLLSNDITWSSNMEALFGLASGEIDGSYDQFVTRLHPEDRARVLEAINTAVITGANYHIEFRVMSAGGRIQWALSQGKVFYDAIGQPIRMYGVDLDITDRKQAEIERDRLTQQFYWLASHDTLTELINRRKFEECLTSVISRAKLDHQQHALCYLDLDQFKIVNDTCGHVAGDKLLKQVTTLLKKQIRQTDTLARLGGDEFGLLRQM